MREMELEWAEIKQFMIKIILFCIYWVISIGIIEFLGFELEFNIIGIPVEILIVYSLANCFTIITIESYNFLFRRYDIFEVFLEKEEE